MRFVSTEKTTRIASRASCSKSNHKIILSFYKERETLMRRTKLHKQYKDFPISVLNSKPLEIEQDKLKGHCNERIHNENIAVTKIRDDPNYFCRYAKTVSVIKIDIGLLLNSSGSCIKLQKKVICIKDLHSMLQDTP